MTNLRFSGKFYGNLGRNFQNEKIMMEWKEGKIGNFEYLMAINRFASRSFNDLNQYPVFPWIIGDYASEELSMSREGAYRDLSKPIGAIVPEARLEAERRYQQFAEDTDLQPHHFGSHYSMSGSVVYFLLRLEPFTSQAILLQDGQFDVADRIFGSIGNAYMSSTRTSGDYKELVPEIYYLPELFLNINQLPLGRCQADHSVNHVDLPPWAHSNPYLFVYLSRLFLESNHVSDSINHWIDLIFGYQQSGEPAKLACNVFLDSTYEGNAREMIQIAKSDPKLSGLLDQILLYGQTPVQLLQVKHPKKNSEISVKSGQKQEKFGDSVLGQLEDFPLKTISAFLVKSGVLIVTEDRKVGLITLKNTPKKYKEKHFRCPDGVFPDPTSPLQPGSCLLLHSAYLVTCLYPDNSFKIHAVERLKQLASVNFHVDVVSCMDADGEYLVVGSQDTTLSVWKVPLELDEKWANPLLWHLKGHRGGVVHCALKWVLQVAVSTSTDGVVLLYSLRTGICTRQLLVFSHPPSLISISKSGFIAVYAPTDTTKISIFSLNGFYVSHLPCEMSKLHTFRFTPSGDFIQIGSEEGLSLLPVFPMISKEQVFPQYLKSRLDSCVFLPSESVILRVSSMLQPRVDVRDKLWTVYVETLRWPRTGEMTPKQQMPFQILGGVRRPHGGQMDKVSPR